jgi:ubiquinone/menaquinone biosynthesis C-methylase UbiE
MEPDDDRIKANLRAAWDAGASQYDAAPRHGLIHDDEWIAWRRLIAAILGDATHSGVRPRRVLDVGTGTGTVALLAAELGHDVVGLDLSNGMLAEARRKGAAGMRAVEWRVGDAEALPSDLRDFDVVASRHLLWTLPHPGRAVAAWREAARPGGLVAVIDGTFLRRPWPMSWAVGATGRWVDWRRRHDPEHRHDYPAELYARLPLARQADTRAVATLFRTAGLEQVRVRRLAEVDRVERAHLAPAERLVDGWRRYLATGRVAATG